MTTRIKEVNPNLKILFPQEAVEQAARALATKLVNSYRDVENVTVVPILNGGLYFAYSLLTPLFAKLNFYRFATTHMQLSSYGKKMQSKGNVELLLKPDARLITGRHVVVIEDLLDTGNSFTAAFRVLRLMEPTSLTFCVLATKQSTRISEEITQHCSIHVLFPRISDDAFLVGCGMDDKDEYRNYPHIASLPRS